jgi:hypothetical protein
MASVSTAAEPICDKPRTAARRTIGFESAIAAFNTGKPATPFFVAVNTACLRWLAPGVGFSAAIALQVSVMLIAPAIHCLV